MNIWLVQIGEPLPIDSGVRKMRTALLADKLVEQGHSVIWWASTFDHQRGMMMYNCDTDIKVSDRLVIKALKGVTYKRNISIMRYIDHRIIARKFRKIAPTMMHPDIIIASMPTYDLSYEAVKYSKKHKIPIIIDVRDQWPDVFFEHFPRSLRRITKFIMCKDFWMLKYTMRNATCLVSMMDGLLKWGLDKASRDRTENDKVYYLGFKKAEVVGNGSRFESLRSVLSGQKFVVTFIGTFGLYYNPSILVGVAKRLVGQNIHFILGGDGTCFDDVKKESEGLNNVMLTGWLSEEDIRCILSYSDVGVIPCGYFIEAFPNKAFIYLSEGLPIISSLQGELREIIEKHEIGFYYSPGKVELIADCIMKLYKNKELCEKMAVNARKIFEEKFDADNIYSDYAEHIKRVALDI